MRYPTSTAWRRPIPWRALLNGPHCSIARRGQPCLVVDRALSLLDKAGMSGFVLSIASLRERFRALVRAGGLPAGLRALNTAVPYRYSAVFRFDGDMLRNVCLVDKLDPSVMRCADQPISESYCIYIQRSRRRFSVENAGSDHRVASHPKRTDFQSYYGVPIIGTDGRLIGTVCHFDVNPVLVTDEVVRGLDEVAETIAETLVDDT